MKDLVFYRRAKYGIAYAVVALALAVGARLLAQAIFVFIFGSDHGFESSTSHALTNVLCAFLVTLGLAFFLMALCGYRDAAILRKKDGWPYD